MLALIARPRERRRGALVDVVFVLVVVLTLVQAPTLRGWPGGSVLSTTTELREIAVDARRWRAGRDLLQVQSPRIPAARLSCRNCGARAEPRSLVVRGDKAFNPERGERLRAELDQRLVVATADSRAAAEDRIRAVDQRGKLARWHVASASTTTEGLATPWRRATRPAGMMVGVSASSIAAAARSGCRHDRDVVLLAASLTKVIGVAELEGRERSGSGRLVYLQLVRNPGAAVSLAPAIPGCSP